LRLAIEARVHDGWEENVHGARFERRELIDLGLIF
jgi:hypothetical protein